MSEKETGKEMTLKIQTSPTDVATRESIYKVLGEESGIDIHVHGGIVRLTGLVDTEESIDFIESAIRKIPGVGEIINELKVKIVQ